MQKSKELIFKCNRLIFMSVIIILILESENLAPVRGIVTDKIVFLKGKCGVAAIQPRHSPPRVL